LFTRLNAGRARRRKVADEPDEAIIVAWNDFTLAKRRPVEPFEFTIAEKRPSQPGLPACDDFLGAKCRIATLQVV
jgi:hypothetical protein